MLFDILFNFHKKCLHEKITPNINHAYCPDCGKFVQNEWYITRCSCCGVKMKAMLHHNQIIPQYKFCHNCGSKEYTVEKINTINFIDINYAVLVKKEIEEELRFNSTQSWQEKNDEQPKLLTQYL